MKTTNLLLLLIALNIAPSTIAAQAPTQKWTPPHTEWGDPDLEGVWLGFENIALERPLALGDQEFYTDAEMAERAAKAKAQGDARKALIAAGKVEHEGFRAAPNYNAIF